MRKLASIVLAALLGGALSFGQTYNGPNPINTDGSAGNFSISTATQSSGTGTVTLGVNLPSGYVVGAWVNISGVAGGTPTGCMNGDYLIQSVASTTSFTFPTTCTANATGSTGNATLLGPSGAVTVVSGLEINVAPGPVWCQTNNNGSLEYLNQVEFNLPANAINYIIFSCPSSKIYASTVPPSPSDLLLATVTTGASSIASWSSTVFGGIQDNRFPAEVPPVLDGVYIVPFSQCAFAQSGTAGTGNNTIIANGASGTPALEGLNTAAASNETLTCQIFPMTKTTANRGVIVNDVQVIYGVQTTSLTSLGTPTFGTITMPASAASETPSTVTPVAAGGTLVVTPPVASANLSTTTAGAFYTELCAAATPIPLNKGLVPLYFTQVFAQSGSAASLVAIAGVIVHYSYLPL